MRHHATHRHPGRGWVASISLDADELTSITARMPEGAGRAELERIADDLVAREAADVVTPPTGRGPR